jgi:phosphatidylserine/phosphatidylglycerophosphate/cardiolipin synthase-like enzyme
MRRFLGLILLVLVPLQVGAGEVRVFFSPRGGCEEAILAQLDRAHRYIHVAMYAFTSRYLAQALVRAKDRGVEVKVVLDRSFQEESEYSKGDYLKRRGIPVKLVTPVEMRGFRVVKGLMHHKFAVIDGGVVITGSYNWTATAERVNYENLLIFVDSPGHARAYEEEFQRLWRSGR